MWGPDDDMTETKDVAPKYQNKKKTFVLWLPLYILRYIKITQNTYIK
jgi:hypothetical protein